MKTFPKAQVVPELKDVVGVLGINTMGEAASRSQSCVIAEQPSAVFPNPFGRARFLKNNDVQLQQQMALKYWKLRLEFPHR